MAVTRFPLLLSTSLCRQWNGARYVHAIQSNSRSRIQEIRNKRVSLYDKEWKRQQALISRLEKIEVSYEGQPENAILIMNKGVSTPFNCAQHISEMLLKRSVVAEVDGEIWDLHRPLEEACTLKLLHMKVEDAHQAALVNRTFWRSCSFLLGAIVESSFKDNIHIILHSFPSANVRSGSFVYDVDLGLIDWDPTQNDLRSLSAAVHKMCSEDLKIHRLLVSESLALQMFEDNPYKSQQIPDIASKSQSGKTVTLYRVGDHIDISRGPMISSTSHIGRFTVTAVHKLNGLYRFQGTALPADLFVNTFVYGLLETRARKLNPARIPELTVKSSAIP